jgi:hypothetical protein
MVTVDANEVFPRGAYMSQPDKIPGDSPDVDEAQAARNDKVMEEKAHPTVSEPDAFGNDPDDPTNPNEAIERHRRKLRP